MTEDEAKQHWCPFVQVTSASLGQSAFSNRLQTARANGGLSNRCLASDCMAWRWDWSPRQAESGPKPSTPIGHCGLAGQP